MTASPARTRPAGMDVTASPARFRPAGMDVTASPARFRLATLPTPLVGAPHLAEELGIGALYVKRDDLTGFALAGNKARPLEFLLAAAVADGADTLVTGGAAYAELGQPVPWEYRLQESASPVMDHITWVHDFLGVLMSASV